MVTSSSLPDPVPMPDYNLSWAFETISPTGRRSFVSALAPSLDTAKRIAAAKAAPAALGELLHWGSPQPRLYK